ncbi:DUF58 domain-containing protein [Ferrimicrobium sp.]|uniref:DUF58 domain-containing protein n=1 Tax=Ferrimicrobium sp. TaxID=2926050 RepID=UPI002611ACEA|nr:DUF58 domain-containing protein [Ferrimicrobium sp.]
MGIRFRGGVVLFSTFLSLLFALFAGGSLAWHLFDFLLVLLAIALFSQLGPLSSILVTRGLNPGPYYAGGWLEVTLTVTATRWPWLHLVMVDHTQSARGTEEHRFVLTTLGDRVQTIRYEVADLQRGSLEFGDIAIITSDFFGFFQRAIRIEQDAIRLHVWPKIIGLSRAELQNYLWNGQQLATRRTRQASTQLQGIREYIPGDRLSHVHWKTTARTGEFKVKHFEPENEAEFIVLLDTASHFAANDWELAISIAASLVYQSNRSQLMLRITTLDQPFDHTSLLSGQSALVRMMDFLSALNYGSHDPLDPVHDARYRGHVLVITTNRYRAIWKSGADSIIIVGDGGVTSLADWRAHLGLTRERASR